MISGGARVKCRVCRAAGGDRGPPPQRRVLRRRASAEHCREQVRRAIDDYDMIAPGERVLVAVSGGKDSLALWDILLDLGYAADGLYLGPRHRRRTATPVGRLRPGLCRRPGGPPDRDRHPDGASASTSRPGRGRPSGCRARRAGCRSATCSTRPPSTAATTWWPPATTSTTRRRCCSATSCGGTPPTSGRQLPVLPASHGFARKVKPLVRLGEREMAAYCVLRGIDYIVEECPMAEGNKHLGYKEALNAIEVQSPGPRRPSTSSFVDRVSALFEPTADERTRGPASLCRLRFADDRRAVRLLQAGGPGHGRLGPATRAGAVLGRRPGPAARQQGPALPGHAGPGRRVPHPRRAGAPRRPPRAEEGITVRSQPGGPLHRGAAHPGRAGAQDAPGRPGHLPQGPRADPDAGRHLPRGAGARGGGGLRGAVDDPAAGRRRHHRLRAAGGLRQPGPGQRRRLPRRGGARAGTASRCGTSTTGSTSRTSTASSSTCPSRGGSSRPPRAPAPRRHPRRPTCPTIGQVAQLREALDHSGFGMAETLEVLQRSWHIEGQSVRPDHRMVAHTGFLTPARLLRTRARRRRAASARAERMNCLDLVIVVAAGAPPWAATGWGSWPGWCRGSAWASACTWPPGSCPDRQRLGPAADPVGRLLVAALVLIGGAFVGQALGLVVGPASTGPPARAAPGGRPGRRRRCRRPRGPGRRVAPAALHVRRPRMAGPRQARTSAIARWVDVHFPRPPDTLQALRRLVAARSLPRGVQRPAPRRDHRAAAPGRRRSTPPSRPGCRPSTVKVEGQACDRIQDGSGFAVGPRPDRHQRPRGRRRAGRAGPRCCSPAAASCPPPSCCSTRTGTWPCCRCPGSARRPLPTATGTVGETGAVFGHPGGQDALWPRPPPSART